jgi:hypothetical protein
VARFVHHRESLDKELTMKGLMTVLVVFAIGCGLEDNQYKKTGTNTASMAITNAEGEDGILRTGTALNMTAAPDLGLKANENYEVIITNLATGSTIAQAKLLADENASLPLTTIAHDVGEFDDVKDNHDLLIKILHGSTSLGDITVPVLPHAGFSGHGFKVDEVQPPHVFSADSAGKPLNAFAVGASPVDAGETPAPIYAAGDGFPPNITTVDIYIMKDRDTWRGVSLPKVPGQSGLVYGPVVGKVQNGVLQATKLDWAPTTGDVGVYDIVVDTDRNGTFDWTFSVKDGADGENKAGFTLQYSQAWFRAKQALTGKHILVNLAYSSAQRNGGAWTNEYSRTSKIYTYVNPPVMQKYHAFVTKHVVPHQSWSKFWNNPEMQIQSGPNAGGIPIPNGAAVTGGTTQHSCTNSPPVVAINPGELPADPQIQKFDVVFDFDNDGIYDPGKDLLDVVGNLTSGDLVTAKDLETLADDQIYGFSVK